MDSSRHLRMALRLAVGIILFLFARDIFLEYQTLLRMRRSRQPGIFCLYGLYACRGLLFRGFGFFGRIRLEESTRRGHRLAMTVPLLPVWLFRNAKQRNTFQVGCSGNQEFAGGMNRIGEPARFRVRAGVGTSLPKLEHFHFRSRVRSQGLRAVLSNERHT